tara:strand:- start:1805 stop:2026 length:222 start_codon:yes stop_codon:yes gene_type:complete
MADDNIELLIKSVRKQIIAIVVGGIISAFTINLIFIFSINNTIEELREYKREQQKENKELRRDIFNLHKQKEK